MPDDVLLVVNCQHDYCYANRHVIQELYARNFPRIAFAVGASCAVDPAFDHIVATWRCDPLKNRCTCVAPYYGEHSANVHCFHTRLADIAVAADDAEYVVFVEDDCILSPRVDAKAIRQMCAEVDALLPPVFFCPRENTAWIWTQHETGYPAYDAVSAQFDRERLLHHWRQYSGTEPPAVTYTPLLSGFVDAFVLRVDLLRRMTDDLKLMREVWHEAAIPTAVVYHASRVGRLNGLALWGDVRQRVLRELMNLLATHDFVHPIKLSTYSQEEILQTYRALLPKRAG